MHVRMLKFWILLFLSISVVGAADKDGQVQWNEHIALCRSPTSYTTRERVKTAQECKDFCAKDRSCLMVKYSKQRRNCWLCDNKSLRPSKKCSAKYDFYIKVLPIPNVSWLTDLRACLQDEPYKIWFIETAQECKTTCAEEENCKMVKYSPEERKCYFSSSTKLMWSRDDDCMVKYDFYTKDDPKPSGKPSTKPLDSLPTETPEEDIGSAGKSEGEENLGTDSPDVETKYPEERIYTPRERIYTPYIIPARQLPGNQPTGSSVVQITKQPEVVLGELWISHPRLCLLVSYYEFFSDVKSERQCRWQCEQQTKCVMVQYDSNSGQCWLSDDREMTPKAGCSILFDYYIKGRNECEGKRGNCHRNAVCKTSRGHRICECVYGFEGDGWSCKDINECSYYKNLCGKHAQCVNKIGGYSCKCKRGFERKNGKCRKGSRSVQKSKAVNDLIVQWKREHKYSAATSAYVTSVWVLVSTFLLAQAFPV